jgi:hypothetical protein
MDQGRLPRSLARAGGSDRLLPGADLRPPVSGGERHRPKAKRGGAICGRDDSAARAHHAAGSDRHGHRGAAGLRHQKVAWDSHANAVWMRDSVAKVLPAQQLFKDLMYPRAQVLVEMYFVEVNRHQESELWPAAAQFVPAVVFQHVHAERAAARPEHFRHAAFRRRGGSDWDRRREPAIGRVAYAFRQQPAAEDQRALGGWSARHHQSRSKVSHSDRRIFRSGQFQRTGRLHAAAIVHLSKTWVFR